MKVVIVQHENAPSMRALAREIVSDIIYAVLRTRGGFSDRSLETNWDRFVIFHLSSGICVLYSEAIWDCVGIDVGLFRD